MILFLWYFIIFLDLTKEDNSDCIVKNIDNNFEEINCVGQGIKSVPSGEDIIWDGKNINRMNLSNNAITLLHEDSFRRFPKLCQIDLSGNRISRIMEKTFKNNPKLETLILRDNDLVIRDSGLAPSSLKYLRNLKKLDLSGNPIGKIMKETFKELTKLETLILNRIPGGIFIERESFSMLKNLQTLSLIQIREDGIGEELVREIESLPKLEELVLARKGLICDCKLKPFIDWLQTKIHEQLSNLVLRSPEGYGVTCSSPQNLMERSLLSLSQIELTCDERNGLENGIKKVSANIGANLTMTCWFDIIQNVNKPSQIQWYQNNVLITRESHRMTQIEKTIDQNNIETNLIITNLMKLDEATYTCESVIQDEGTRAKAHFLLNVGNEFEEKNWTLIGVENKINKKKVSAGGNLTMICRFKILQNEKKLTQVKWYQNNILIKHEAYRMTQRARMIDQNIEMNLTITNLVKFDEATYTCEFVTQDEDTKAKAHFLLIVGNEFEEKNWILDEILENKIHVMIAGVFLVIFIVTFIYAVVMLRGKNKCRCCGYNRQRQSRIVDKSSPMYLQTEALHPPLIGFELNEGKSADYSGLKRISINYDPEVNYCWQNSEEPTGVCWTQTTLPINNNYNKIVESSGCPVHQQTISALQLGSYAGRSPYQVNMMGQQFGTYRRPNLPI